MSPESKPLFDAFYEKVFLGLPSFNMYEGFREGVYNLWLKDFSVEDAIRYAKCWEEVSPDLDEQRALDEMKAIGAKYPKYKSFGR